MSVMMIVVMMEVMTVIEMIKMPKSFTEKNVRNA